MRPVALIMSGAYLDQELAAELGFLPPAFVPVGMRRLYELQIEALAPLGAEIFMTAPQSMAVAGADRAILAAAGVTLIPSAAGLNLAQAVLGALAVVGFDERPLHLLHGDTLILDGDLATTDAVSVAPGADGYHWATVTEDDGLVLRISPPDPGAAAPPPLRLSGYFSFSSARAFAEALARAPGDFLGALNLYAATRPLRLLTSGRWLDFGHVQTFFRSRRVISTQRAFNDLTITDAVVRKRSADRDKLRAEAHWLANAPPSIRPFCARLVDAGEDAQGGHYATDYEYLPTLAEIHVFGRLNRGAWQDVLSGCGAFMDAARQVRHAPEPGALAALVKDKTRARLDVFARQTGFDLDAPQSINGRPTPSVRDCAETAIGLAAAEPDRPALMHGDFCFSNILYNFRMRRIRLIDPRGCVQPGVPSLYGDSLYDAAKLMHSVAGLYDVVLAGRCRGTRTLYGPFEIAFDADADHDWLIAAARGREMGGVLLGSLAVEAVVVLLFFSMLPLHADRPERQAALLANGLRLFRALDDGRGA